MRIGFIGAGRAGTSVAKYFSGAADVCISGFYSERAEDAAGSAAFVGAQAYGSADALAADSDWIFISTGDSDIAAVWEQLDKAVMRGKLAAHLSGSLGSDILKNAAAYGIAAGSLHPAYAFDDKFTSYQNMGGTVFTAEGDERFLEAVRQLTGACGNRLLIIDSKQKTLYHAAASLASNHMLGLLSLCADMLGQCGLQEDDAYALLRPLMSGNLSKALSDGADKALTGPIERGDAITVGAHLKTLDTAGKEVYNALGKSVLSLARKKHEGDRQHMEKYNAIERMLNHEEYGSDVSAE